MDGRLLRSRASSNGSGRDTTLKGIRQQLELLTIEASRKLAENGPAEPPPSLHEFIQDAWKVLEPRTPFVDGRHIQAICEHLEATYFGDIKRLLINMPPRFMKSSIVSVMWPVWCWIMDPSLKWLCASYALSLAIRDNRRCRQLIQSAWFQERYGNVFQFQGDMNLKGRFENTAMGTRLCCSTGAAATGEGGDILLGDDFHAIDDKESQVAREAVIDWFDTTWSTRLNDPQAGAMVVVGQRIHSADISGHLLEQGGWEHLNLPAFFEPQRACRTLIWQDWRIEEGELLWPERFPAPVLEEQKKKLGAMGFSALYQQSPVSSTGGKFKANWFRYFTETESAYLLETPQGVQSVLKSSCWRFGTSDLAISSRQTADYTVFAVWAVVARTSDLLLLHVFRDRIDNAEQLRQLKLLHLRFQPDFWKIETVAYQAAFLQMALRDGIPCREYRPVRDKESRATTASVWSENGKTYWPKGTVWLPDIEAELLQFPRGAHDDFTDCYSQAADQVCSPAVPLSGEGDDPVYGFDVQTADTLATYDDAVSLARQREADLDRQIAEVRQQLEAARSAKKG